jgi:hypothetical protein
MENQFHNFYFVFVGTEKVWKNFRNPWKTFSCFVCVFDFIFLALDGSFLCMYESQGFSDLEPSFPFDGVGERTQIAFSTPKKIINENGKNVEENSFWIVS